ncbi:MAG: glycosyl hydrolase 115 family protein [Clostridia bacterium]|nr:glycosyl hydrolase 115 family protein [Clostridia bacterium]
MKKIIAIILCISLCISFSPQLILAEDTISHSTLFSWNFTTGTKYSTPKVSGTSATSVSWGNYRVAFMAFPIPDTIEQDNWVISDGYMTFDNGRKSSQAPTVTIKMIDGDSLMEIHNSHSAGTITDASATASLANLRDTGKIVGTFSTLTSDMSSHLSIGDEMKSLKEAGKKYIGFYLTCRSEDNAASAGIVNFVKPVLSTAPEIEEVVDLDVIISPQVLKKGESITITPTLSPVDAIITNIVSFDESIANASFTDNSITVNAINTGFAEITISIEYEDKTMDKTFSVSVTENNTCEDLPSVTIFENGSFAPIVMDESYSDAVSYNQIKRASGDFRQDMALVSGIMDVNSIPIDDTSKRRDARLASLNMPEIESTAIIIGSVESSEIIQSLILSGKLDEAAQIKGNWEGYVIKKVKNPTGGIENALVIAGSDTRGTIYGIYALSEKMGVSPWYWWSDVAIDTKSSCIFTEDTIVNEGPDVAYRGIFINDEEHFVNWCEHHFPDDYAMDGVEVNGPNAYIYNHMYELLLRLGANTLWPAMHEYTTAFNYDTDENGIPFNAKAAAEYGIVMSSSHCEVMLRGNVGEWEPWYNQNKDKYNIQGSSVNAAYDYTLNKEAILAYWKERLIANKDFESIFVLGIRGVHDGAPRYANLSGAGYGSGTTGIVNMMKDVITEQRNMIKEIYGNEDAVPQVFIPYKEMNTYYNHNNGDLAAWLPEDVIVMYAEDNQNYLRQTSTAAERARSGGLGIYYHNSYWGTPKSYLWLNSTSTTLMYEEMRKAYDTGAEKYWILNVGDLKPGELNCEFFMRMAWDIDRYDDTNIYTEFYKNQAMRDYGLSEEAADVYADALKKVNSLVMAKKAEFFGYTTTSSATNPYFPSANAFPFSITEHGDEGQLMVNRWNELVDTLGDIYSSLPDDKKDSFYEQIYHFVLSYRNRNEEYVYYWKNQLYFQQGRYASTSAYADLSRKAVKRLSSDQEYYNSLNNGKWSGMLDYDHIIYYQSNQGALRVKDSMYYSSPATAKGIGAVCEGQTLPADDVTLKFNSLADNKRFIDIFGKNVFKESYVIECDDFITLSKTSGSVYTEERITVSINWDVLTKGNHTGIITVYNADEDGNKEDAVNTFTVEAVKSAIELEENTYSEANGFVAIEAERFTQMLEGADGSYWAVVENLGQSGDGVKGFPDLADKVNIYATDNAAQLVYRIYFETAGTFQGMLYRLPTLNEGSENGEARSCNIAVGLKGEAPTLLTGNRDTSGTWGANVMRGHEPLAFTITIPEKGYYDLLVYKIDSSIAFDRIVIETTSTDSSHIGPPESPNNICETTETVIGTVPSAVAEIVPNAAISPLGNLTVGVGTVNQIKISKADDATVTFSVLESSTAFAEYENDILTIYGLKEGSATIIAHVTEEGFNDGYQEFPVFVTNDTDYEGYKEVNGELVINTKDAMLNSAYATHTDISTHTWALADEGIQLTPNTGKNWTTASSVPSSAPSISFVAEFTTPGTYYVAANFSNPDDASDSFHFGLDGTLVFSSNTKNNRVVTKATEWFSHSSWTVEIPKEGEYTLNLWAREDGVVINQLYLSQFQVTDGQTGNLKTTPGESQKLTPLVLSDEERVELDSRFVFSGYDLTAVYDNLNISEQGSFSSNIIWQSSDESVIALNGQVTTPECDTFVTLTGTFTYGNATKTVTYDLIAKAEEEIINSASGFKYNNFTPFSTHSYISFDLTAKAISDGFIGIAASDKSPTSYGAFPICFRICPDGYFDAHDGTKYTTVDTVPYEANKTYRVVMDVDVTNQVYSAYVVTDGEVKTVAKDFKYRATATDFEKITVCPGSGVTAGLFNIKNLTVSTMPYTIMNLSVNDSNFTADILYFGQTKQKDSVVVAHYNGNDEMTSVSRTPLSLTFGEIYPVECEIGESTSTLNIMVMNNKLTPLSVNKKLNFSDKI